MNISIQTELRKSITTAAPWKRTAFILLFLLNLTFAAAFADESTDGLTESSGSLEVKVSSLKSSQGGVMINLYRTGDGFPTKPQQALEQRYIKPDSNLASVIFNPLPYGNYAVAVCHDENGNRDCDSNFLGIPQEGVGVSNNAKGFMGPPSYEDARITLNNSHLSIAIDVSY